LKVAEDKPSSDEVVVPGILTVGVCQRSIEDVEGYAEELLNLNGRQ
jgi:hypothetical protein